MVAGRISLGLGCQSCHGNTAADSSTIVGGGGQHIDADNYDVVPAAATTAAL